ncbi:MAG: hypothetical protein ACE5LB_17825 [Acidiferrobacterales bacterium]
MIESGWIIYVLLAVLLYLFWRQVRGMSFNDLLDRSAREHHHVLKVIGKHPKGGSWREHKQWMRAGETKPRRRARRR